VNLLKKKKKKKKKNHPVPSGLKMGVNPKSDEQQHATYYTASLFNYQKLSQDAEAVCVHLNCFNRNQLGKYRPGAADQTQ